MQLYKNEYQNPRRNSASWITLPFFRPWLVKHQGEYLFVLVPPSLVFLAPVLFCNMHIHIDVPFMRIFVFSLLLISPSPGILSPTSRIFPYLIYLEDSRIGNNFYYNPKCTLSLHQPTHSGTWVLYQQEHPFHDHLLVEVTPPPQTLRSSPSNTSIMCPGSELQRHPDVHSLYISQGYSH